MMKIHTTQDLNSLVQLNQLTTNNVSSKDFRLKNYSEQMLMPRVSAEKADYYSTSISFCAKGVKDSKKIIKGIKKCVGDIAKEPKPEIKRGDGIIESSPFNWILSKHRYEPVIQAGAAGIICTLLRPATIMALPSKGKSKEDNTYAASHSIASGLMGLVTAFALTMPFKKGGDYVMETIRKDFDIKVLERLYPQLKLESIWEDKAKNIRKPISDWLNKDGKKFIDNVNDIQFLPAFKQLADVSELTYSKILKLDVDWASQKGKSFNDVVLKDGSKLYDKLDMSKVGIVVEEEGFDKAQILLKDIDKEYLKKVIEDSKGSKDSNWGSLDINSMYDKNDKVIDFRQWKDVNGKQWKLDLDQVYISSPIEEITRRPRVTGAKRYDTKSNTYKLVAYQNNGVDGGLGTAIDEKIADTALKNESQIKLLTWGPDIITRVPIAAATIALIPWTLKHVFGLEKKSKKKDQAKNNLTEKQLNNQIADNDSKAITFKGAKKDAPKKVNWFIKQFGKYYGKKIIESPTIAKLSEKLNKIPGKLTEHMMTLGSLITSSVYMNRTLNNKDLDPERKVTLAVNQCLCFLIPTAAAYTVNHLLDKKIKNFEYRVSNKIQYAQDLAKIEGKEVPKFAKNMKNVKGIRILSGIGVFTLIYRYITPVAVTPGANKFGNWLNNILAERKAKKAKEISLNSDAGNAKEVSTNSDDVKANSKQVA